MAATSAVVAAGAVEVAEAEAVGEWVVMVAVTVLVVSAVQAVALTDLTVVPLTTIEIHPASQRINPATGRNPHGTQSTLTNYDELYQSFTPITPHRNDNLYILPHPLSLPNEPKCDAR